MSACLTVKTNTKILRNFIKKCRIYHENWWRREIQNQSKLNVHNEIIICYGNPNPIAGIMRKQERSLLCQLLCGNLKLNVELGRYRNIPINERLCSICDSNQIEDCYHFLFDCKALVLPHILMLKTVCSVYNDFVDLTLKNKRHMNNCKLLKTYVKDLRYLRRSIIFKKS